MIREFSQKNNIFYLAFLVAELPPLNKDVFTYAAKTRPKEFLDKLINTPLYELHEYLVNISKEMNNKPRNDINFTLYS